MELKTRSLLAEQYDSIFGNLEIILADQVGWLGRARRETKLVLLEVESSN